MWALLLASIFASLKYSPCTAYRRFSSVTIHDPLGSSNYFTAMLQFPENQYLEKFKTWSREEQKKACFRALVDAAPFLVVGNIDGDLLSEPAPPNFDKDAVFAAIHKSFRFVDKKVEYKLPLVEVEAHTTTALEVPAHYCVNIRDEGDAETEVQFAITSGYHRDVLFLLSKRSDYPKFKTIAIVEPIPLLDLKTLRKRDLGTAYLTGNVQPRAPIKDAQQDSEEQEGSPEDDDFFESEGEDENRVRVCELDEFHRYRLCATAYTAWMQFKNEMYRGIDYIVRPGLTCMEKQKLHILSDEGLTETSETDLLPCLIRQNSNPQIFVADDKFDDEAVFVLEAIYDKSNSDILKQPASNEHLEYSLVLHLQNVASLLTFEDEV